MTWDDLNFEIAIREPSYRLVLMAMARGWRGVDHPGPAWWDPFGRTVAVKDRSGDWWSGYNPPGIPVSNIRRSTEFAVLRDTCCDPTGDSWVSR